MACWPGGAYEWVVEAGWLGDEEAITPELTRVRYEYEALQLQLTLPTGETLRSYQDGGYTLETEGGERLTMSGERFAFEQPHYYRIGEPPVQIALELTDFEITVTRTCPEGDLFCSYDETVTGRGTLGGPALGAAVHFEVLEGLKFDASSEPEYPTQGKVQLADDQGNTATIEFADDAVTITYNGAVTSHLWAELCESYRLGCE